MYIYECFFMIIIDILQCGKITKVCLSKCCASRVNVLIKRTEKYVVTFFKIVSIVIK